MANVEELDAGAEWLRVAADLEALPLRDAWLAWTDAEAIVRWWPQEAEIDLRVDGAYLMRWPAMGWMLRGTYTEVDPERRLAFTWGWDHQPDLPQRTVALDFQPLPAGGTRLIVTHGPYGEGDAEAADRQSHLNGWRQFLARLAELDAAAATEPPV